MDGRYCAINSPWGRYCAINSRWGSWWGQNPDTEGRGIFPPCRPSHFTLSHTFCKIYYYDDATFICDVIMVPVANPVPNIRNISSVENAHKPLVYIDQRIQLNRYIFVGFLQLYQSKILNVIKSCFRHIVIVNGIDRDNLEMWHKCINNVSLIPI